MIKLIILIVCLSSSIVFAYPCDGLLEKISEPPNTYSLQPLIDKIEKFGIDHQQLELKTLSGWNHRLALYLSGNEIGFMVLTRMYELLPDGQYDKSRPIYSFETHISVDYEYQRKGIGTLLYVLAGKFAAARRFPLFSTQKSSTTILPWSNMTMVGWSEYNVETRRFNFKPEFINTPLPEKIAKKFQF